MRLFLIGALVMGIVPLTVYSSVIDSCKLKLHFKNEAQVSETVFSKLQVRIIKHLSKNKEFKIVEDQNADFKVAFIFAEDSLSAYTIRAFTRNNFTLDELFGVEHSNSYTVSTSRSATSLRVQMNSVNKTLKRLPETCKEIENLDI